MLGLPPAAVIVGNVLATVTSAIAHVAEAMFHVPPVRL